MPAGRPRNDAKHLRAATDALMRAVSSLSDRIGAMGVKVKNTKEPKGSASGAHPNKGVANAKNRSIWASYTPKQRAARIAAMKAGHAKRKRRLTAKGEAKPGPTRAPATRVARKPGPAVRKSAWASLTPEQRAERMAKMRAGRKGAVAPVGAATEA